MRCGTEGVNAGHGPTRAGPSRGSSVQPTEAEGTFPPLHTHSPTHPFPGAEVARQTRSRSPATRNAAKTDPPAPPRLRRACVGPRSGKGNGPSIARGRSHHTATPGEQLRPPRVPTGGQGRPRHPAHLCEAEEHRAGGAAAGAFEMYQPAHVIRATRPHWQVRTIRVLPGAFWGL